jgi:hypothetical protein
MNRGLFWVVAGLGAFLSSPQVAALDSMECGSQLVSVGDSQQKVLDTCGQPDATHGLVQTNQPAPDTLVGPEGVSLNPNVVWIYRGSPGQMDKSLTFEGGSLRVIQTGE